MFFTQEDLDRLIMWAVWRTSRSLGIIGDDEPFAPQDAVQMIAASKGHIDALRAFVDAYVDWYAFHVAIYKAGKSGSLSPGESQQLVQLVERREQAKQTLMDITA